MYSSGFAILSIYAYSDELITKVIYDREMSRYKLCNDKGNTTTVEEKVVANKEKTNNTSDSTMGTRSIPKCVLGHPLIYTLSHFNDTDLMCCNTCNELLCESNELVYCYYCKECKSKMCMACISLDSSMFTTKDIHNIFNGILSITDLQKVTTNTNTTTNIATTNDGLIAMDKMRNDIENINDQIQNNIIDIQNNRINNLKIEVMNEEINAKLSEILTLLSKK
jgi:hypothetical protein